MKKLISTIHENDLLISEKVSSEDYGKMMQDRLREAMQGKEKAETALWRLRILCEAVFCIALVLIFIYDLYVYTYWSLAIVGFWIVFGTAVMLPLEKYSRVAAGHCRCEKCGAVYLPTAKAWLGGMVFSLKRMYLKCPHCKKMTKHKKVLVEE